MTLIHFDTHPYDLGPRWTAVQQPFGVTDPMVVRFIKQGQKRKLLDQTARWNGRGWDPARWVPAHPCVPRTLLGIVERHMREVHHA